MSYFHSFKFRPAIGPDSLFAFPEAMPQGQASPTRVGPITPDFSNQLAFRGVPSISHMAQYGAQGTSGDSPQHFPHMSVGPALVPLSQGRTSLDRSPGAIKAIKGPYSCRDCGKGYAQPQGLNRHRREMHKPKLCTFCGDFKWGRRYRLKEHLKSEHPELDADEALGEATRACQWSYGDFRAEDERTKCRNVKIS
jgi:hypothetical protein